MQQAKIKELYGYWLALKGKRPAPQRRELEPSLIKHLLCDMFILETGAEKDSSIRLSGTRVSAWFGHDLKGFSFSRLWTPRAAKDIDRILKIVSYAARPALIGLEARAGHGEKAKLEMLLLPLEHQGRTDCRVLGCMVSRHQPNWLGISPITGLSITKLEFPKPEEAPQPTAHTEITQIPRQYGSFLVFDGGKS